MDKPQPVTIGFYRWTDVFFQWPEEFVHRPGVRSALKAFLHHESLVHPSHPFRAGDVKEEDVDRGAKLWLGTLQNGASRLMFSTAQLEYARYWLKCLGITDGELIPLPNSSYLLRMDNELRTASPVYYTDPKEIAKAQTKMDKINKRLRLEQMVLDKRAMFEKARSCWHDHVGTWCAIDFETNEYDHKLVIEVGLSTAEWHNGELVHRREHSIVLENSTYINHQYVEDNRDHYLYGKTRIERLANVKDGLKRKFIQMADRGPLFLVVHGGYSDLKILNEWNVLESPACDVLPEGYIEDGIYSLDTQDFINVLMGTRDNRKLKDLCAILKLPPLSYFHNAGNDAHYTMMALEAMIGGPPLDIQREERWPTHVQPDLTVKLPEPKSDGEDEDEDEGADGEMELGKNGILSP